MFTEDVVRHRYGRDRFDDARIVAIARLFVVVVVAVTYALSLLPMPRLFRLGIWCFSGFSALFPLAVAACYWRRLTAAGAIACVVGMLVSGGLLLWRSGFAANPEYTFLGMLPVATMTATSTVAMVVVSLVTRPPSAATIARYLGRPR
jgi:solute:Na+ symporter, SSS family